MLLDYSIKLPKKAKMSQDIANCQLSNGDTPITTADFEIVKKTISYCMKDKNPVDSVKFFKKSNPSESFSIKAEEVSLLIPAKFSERYIRVFVKDPKKLTKVKQAFKRYCQKYTLTPN